MNKWLINFAKTLKSSMLYLKDSHYKSNMARDSGISSSTISSYMSGTTKPNLDNLEKIASAMDTSPTAVLLFQHIHEEARKSIYKDEEFEVEIIVKQKKHNENVVAGKTDEQIISWLAKREALKDVALHVIPTEETYLNHVLKKQEQYEQEIQTELERHQIIKKNHV